MNVAKGPETGEVFLYPSPRLYMKQLVSKDALIFFARFTIYNCTNYKSPRFIITGVLNSNLYVPVTRSHV